MQKSNKASFVNGSLLTLTAVLVAGSSGNAAEESVRPNILWVTSEDNSTFWMGCYGNKYASTPNIDRLASEGFRYTHVYASAPVCAPSRSTWITGINAVSMGTHPMRSRYTIPHNKIKYYPDLLRKNGYYTVNLNKTDYNIGGRKDNDCWDVCAREPINWKKVKAHQPFFLVVNCAESHESRAQGDVNHTKHDPADLKLRSYHPELPDIRKNYAKYYDCVSKMDQHVGRVLRQLEQQGLKESTIVIYCSDHGGVLPRSKRFIFDSGLHCPLVLRIPEKYRDLWPVEKAGGTTVDRLVSYVDMPKTWLAITGSVIPDYMQGRIFLGPKTEPEARWHFAFRGRMDERLDNSRVVCNKEFLYIRNYMPYVPWMQHLLYLWKMRATVAWDKYVQAGNGTDRQTRWFRPRNFTEELYDLRKDPDNVNNLIRNPEYSAVAKQMRAALRQRQIELVDAGLLPQSEISKLAHDNRMTVYEVARNPKLYDTARLLDAADLALVKDPASLKTLRAMLESPDIGNRYWGIVGAFLLNDKESGLAALNDSSDEVRAMAAWLCIRTGEKERGLNCLKSLLEEKSYASLTVLNILDWMGGDAKPLLPAVKLFKPKEHMIYGQTKGAMRGYEGRMRQLLLQKYGLQD